MKRKTGNPLTSAEKGVLNVFIESSEDNPHITLDEGTDVVAYASGISKSSMYCSRK